MRALAEQIRKHLAEQGKRWIDGLVNNAGTFTYWLTITPEGFEKQWAVNHLAPFLLTHELLPLLQAAPAGRVVTVSSGSHYNTRLSWEDIQLRRRYNGLAGLQADQAGERAVQRRAQPAAGSGLDGEGLRGGPRAGEDRDRLQGEPRAGALDLGQAPGGRGERRSSRRRASCILVERAVDPGQPGGVLEGRASQATQLSTRWTRDVARRLWELSAQMCGIGYGLDYEAGSATVLREGTGIMAV